MMNSSDQVLENQTVSIYIPIMVLIEGNIATLDSLPEPVALTVGSFDGVHRGHVHLLQTLKKEAAHRNLKTAVLTFDPHPNSLLENSQFKALQTKSMRLEHLRRQAVDYLVVQDFSKAFSVISREDFLRQYLLRFFSLRFVLFGYDFRFGWKGQGDFDFANLFFKNRGIGIDQARAFREKDEILSSSKIRDLLSKGKIEEANQFLGYPFSLEGTVVKGQLMGRKLGFPTANLEEVCVLVPGQGVYAGWVFLEGQKRLAVMNIGRRPTIQKTGNQNRVQSERLQSIVQEKIFLECHIPDFSGDLYNCKLCFTFARKLRNERKFSSLDELKNQIQKDVDEAKRALNSGLKTC